MKTIRLGPGRGFRLVLTVLLASAAFGSLLMTSAGAASPASMRTSSFASADSGYKPIRNADGDRLCIDVRSQDNYYADGARAQQWSCSDAAEQQWLLDDVSSTYGIPNAYHIVSQRSGKCLDESDGNAGSAFGGPTGPNGEGQQIVQEPCYVAQSDTWVFNPSTHEVVSLLSHLCLDTTSNARGSMVMQWPCNGNLAQRWLW
jgi:hypothetical protein